MKNVMRKSIYGLLYLGIVLGFIYIGSKDYNIKAYQNDQERFSKEYDNIPIKNNFDYISSTEFINILKNGTGIIFVGDKDNIWSKEYAKLIYDITKEKNIEKIYYFDAKKTKTLKNSNYYEIIKLLDGNLTSTDSSDDNLFTPSLYILNDGKIKFFDNTSAAVKNGETIESFWHIEKKADFKNTISNAININIDNQ